MKIQDIGLKVENEGRTPEGRVSAEEWNLLISDVLLRADKKFDRAAFSGIGRKYLRKNIISGVNVLTESMLSQANTSYIVQYDYDLRGASVTIPAGCELRFEGGSISNGTLVGSATAIVAERTRIFGNNIVISGEWKCQDIYDSWFPMDEAVGADNRVNLQNICNLTSDNHSGVIHMSNKVYYATIVQSGDDQAMMHVNSNTEIVFDCTFMLNTNDFKNYRLININSKENVYIHGQGSVIGDVDGKTIGSGEHGHGLAIIDSKNVVIEGLKFAKCWGDGVYIGQNVESAELYSERVILKNVICDYNRRQGLTITAAKDAIIENCQFSNTGIIKGTPPAFGVDIEPNILDAMLTNIHFRHCYFNNNNSGGLLALNGNNTTSIFVENCVSDGVFKLANNAKNVTYIGCTFPNLEVGGVTPSPSDNIIFVNCNINTDEGLFMCKYYNYTFKNCSFAEVNGISQKVYELSTSESAPVCKVLIPAERLIDGYYKVTAMGAVNVRNIHYISEFTIRVRSISSTKTVARSSTRIITHNNKGAIDLESYKNDGFLMNQPTLDASGNLVMYIANANGVRFNIALVVEAYSIKGNNGLVGCQCTAAPASEMPNTDYSFVPRDFVQGTTSRIDTYIAKEVGVCVYNTSVKKAVWWNGSAWVDAMGNAI